MKNVAVVGGGSLAKLGMKAHFHMEKKMPVLEDLLGGVAFFLSSDGTAGTPYINLEIVDKNLVLDYIEKVPLEKNVLCIIKLK